MFSDHLQLFTVRSQSEHLAFKPLTHTCIMNQQQMLKRKPSKEKSRFMKVNGSLNRFRSLMMVMAASVALSACGSLPAASTAVPGPDGTLSTLALDGTAAADSSTAQAGRPGKGGKGGDKGGKMGPGGHGKMGFGLAGPQLASLNLSDQQKTQIQALQTEAQAFFEAKKPAEADAPRQGDHEAARAAFEAAFKSDSFDPAALSAARPARPAASEAMIDFQVDQMIKLHAILTPEQRARLAQAPEHADRAQAPEQADRAQPAPPADAAERQNERLDKLATALSLSDAQKTQLGAIFTAEASARQAEHERRRSGIEAQHKAISDLLTAASVDRSALKTLLQARTAEAPDSDHLEQLAQIHAILTAEQRATFLTLNIGPGGPGGPAGPGFGAGRHEGPGGKGFGGPGAGLGMKGQPFVPGF